MDKIASQIETVCLVSIFIGLISSVIPLGRLKNAFTGLCAAVLIFSMAAPLSKISKKAEDIFPFSSSKNDDMLLSDVKTAEKMLFEKTLENAIEKKLESDGITVTVRVAAENKNGEYQIISFSVRGELTQNEKIKIQDYLKSAFTVSSISFEEEDNG